MTSLAIVISSGIKYSFLSKALKSPSEGFSKNTSRLMMCGVSIEVIILIVNVGMRRFLLVRNESTVKHINILRCSVRKAIFLMIA